jgi:hypothetical protein
VADPGVVVYGKSHESVGVFLMSVIRCWIVSIVTGSLIAGPAYGAEQGEGDLAKASQNPIGNMISLPFQNNTSFGIGPNDAVSNALNIQPVYPVSLSPNWNLSDKWSAGAGAVILSMPGNWVLGVLVQNVWSFAGDDNAADINQMLLQPIINYNLNDGWYLTSVPVITANWEADSDNRWTIPLGGGFGKITKWGKQPLDLQMQAFYNVEKPNPLVGQGINIDNQGETWTLRLQLKLLFPK